MLAPDDKLKRRGRDRARLLTAPSDSAALEECADDSALIEAVAQLPRATSAATSWSEIGSLSRSAPRGEPVARSWMGIAAALTETGT
jgi:hypothetical protein